MVEEIDTIDIENSREGILIQSYAKDEVPQVDIEIINSIIFNQIQDVGYREEIFLNKDLLQSQLIEEFSLSCRDDECAAKNANYLNAKHVLAWEFSESEDLLYIRIFDPLNYSNSITSDILSDPYNCLLYTSPSPRDQ